jgi:hypothetical protein
MDLESLAWMVAGAALAAARLLPLIKVSIHTKRFAAQIVKLLDQDDPSRALKLCKAAPGAPSVRIVQVTLDAARELARHESEGRIRDALEEAFDKQRDEELARLRKRRWLAPLGVLIAILGAAGVLASETEMPGQAGIAALAVVLALMAHRIVRTIAADSAAIREGLVTAVAALVRRHGGSALDVSAPAKGSAV